MKKFDEKKALEGITMFLEANDIDLSQSGLSETPKRIVKAYQEFLSGDNNLNENIYGNPSSIYSAGRKSRSIIEEARNQIAQSDPVCPWSQKLLTILLLSPTHAAWSAALAIETKLVEMRLSLLSVPNPPDVSLYRNRNQTRACPSR